MELYYQVFHFLKTMITLLLIGGIPKPYSGKI